MENKPSRAKVLSFRERLNRRLFTSSEIPIVVYAAVVLAFMACYWFAQRNELAADFLPEIFGAAFTLFIIDILLVRSKQKRWKVVRDDIDYLIARNVNRLRDGLSIRAFGFVPDVDGSSELHEQRRKFLSELESLSVEELPSRFAEQELFSNDIYAYFNERADGFWDILNMKYSEYLSPKLVSELIALHVALKDAGSHIRQYRKAERFVQDKEFYQSRARQDMAVTLSEVIGLLNTLYEQGYSDSARSGK